MRARCFPWGAPKWIQPSFMPQMKRHRSREFASREVGLLKPTVCLRLENLSSVRAMPWFLLFILLAVITGLRVFHPGPFNQPVAHSESLSYSYEAWSKRMPERCSRHFARNEEKKREISSLRKYSMYNVYARSSSTVVFLSDIVDRDIFHLKDWRGVDLQLSNCHLLLTSLFDFRFWLKIRRFKERKEKTWFRSLQPNLHATLLPGKFVVAWKI